MEPSGSTTSPHSAAEEDSELDALGDGKSDLGKKPSQWMQAARLRQFREYSYKIRNRVRELNRKKDVVCLILSYPPFTSRNYETHRGWIRDVLEITHKAREALYPEKAVNVLELSSEILRLLLHSIHDIEAHVPSHILVKMYQGWSPGDTTLKKTMLDFAIDDFMIRQILQYIQLPEFRRIWISTVNDITFVSRLKNLPPIRKMFDLVIQVNVRFCLAVTDIEDRIIEELGFSKSSRPEAEELLRSQNFLILLDGFDSRIDSHDLGISWWNLDNIQKIALISIPNRQKGQVDLEIRRKDHLLSWELFCRNVGEVVHSSSIQQLAAHVLRQCSGHLLATVVMAKALKEVKDVHIWQHASRVIGFLLTSDTEDGILFNSLAFVLQHLGPANKCVKYSASYLGMEGTDKVDLLERWMNEDLIGTLDEGELIVQHLVNALLLESFQNGKSIRMRDEIRKEVVNLYKAEMNPILIVELDGRGLVEAPKYEAWEEANEMHLMNNKISKLSDSPNCHKLRVLFLEGNHHLRVISPNFFQYMPILQILDLSQTKIKSLPQSLFKLVQLRKFILRSCELFKELPPEVGELCLLEVLDLEGTEIINLPITIGKLTNLTCLKLSFYSQNNHNGENNQSNKIIPENVISNLLQLEELSIDVNPDDKRWNVIVQDIVKEVCSLNHLEILKLYLPEVVLLNDLRKRISWRHFSFIVGSNLKRIISRLPLEVVVKFEEEERRFKYVNGEGVPTEIKEVLQHASALFLDRHLTVTSVSEFGIENMENLKFCVLRECNEVQTIVDARNDRNVVLGSLEYLNLHYMKNLRSIWKGPPGWMGSLSHLKALALYTCPQLATIFTFNMVQELHHLEELVVEDCPEINSIVTHEVLAKDLGPWTRYLPKLKKISLHYMPKLLSISGILPIAPELEWLSFYDCPNLKILCPEEVSSSKLKVIIGEADWWNGLKWNKSERFQPPNLDAVFVPIERDTDLRTQLAEINNLLQAQMQETEPSQQSGPGDALKAPAVEAGSSSKQKQVA